MLAGTAGECECVPQRPVELALSNQNDLPSRAEKKHSAVIFNPIEFDRFRIGGQQFLFLTLSFPRRLAGGSGGCFLSPSVFFGQVIQEKRLWL
jgi:hypothetical protein